MTNWRTNIGGAVGALGTTLAGAGVVSQLGGNHSEVIWWMTIAGFVLGAVSKFLTALFAADATEVKRLSDAVKTAADTATLKREQETETKS